MRCHGLIQNTRLLHGYSLVNIVTKYARRLRPLTRVFVVLYPTVRSSKVYNVYEVVPKLHAIIERIQLINTQAEKK